MALVVAAGRFDRCGSVVARELRPGAEPVDVVEVAEHDRGGDRADTVEFGRRCPGTVHGVANPDLDRCDLGVEATDIGEMLTGETCPFGSDRIRADVDPFEEICSLSCADPDRCATGGQLAQHHMEPTRGLRS